MNCTKLSGCEQPYGISHLGKLISLHIKDRQPHVRTHTQPSCLLQYLYPDIGRWEKLIPGEHNEHQKQQRSKAEAHDWWSYAGNSNS